MDRSTQTGDQSAPSIGVVTQAGAGRPSAPPIRPTYLHGAREPFVVMFHPSADPRREIGAVLCPPFGWEEMASYRLRRAWAQSLAQEGVASLRIELPGTGDSAGYPTQEDRLDSWTDAIGDSARWLRHETGCRRVVAIGIGIGGLLAYRAAALDAPIDDLVLWGAPARGRTFVREIRAFARMEAIQRDKDDEADRDQLPADWLTAGGYLITAQTRAALEALDVSELPLPFAEARNVLLLERDGIGVDALLLESLQRQHVSVETMPGEGYGEMMVEPQFARYPEGVVERVGKWMSALDAEPSSLPLADEVPRASTEARVRAPDGTSVRESFFAIGHPLGDMFGVLSEPLENRSDVTALLLGGTGHRIGPNRMWVEAARRWAAWGVPSVRLDLAGAGDAGGNTPADVPGLHTPELTEQLNVALDELTQMELPARTVTIGLCVGAYWAIQAALSSNVEVIPLMLNPRVLIWDQGEHVDRLTRHYLAELRRSSGWKRLLRGDVAISRALTVMMRRLTMSGPGQKHQPDGQETSTSSGDIDQMFDELRDRGRRALIVFTGRESLHRQFQREGRLERLERWPNLTLEVVPGVSDLHTLRQIWLQRCVHELLDEGLRRELARPPDGAPRELAHTGQSPQGGPRR